VTSARVSPQKAGGAQELRRKLQLAAQGSLVVIGDVDGLDDALGSDLNELSAGGGGTPLFIARSLHALTTHADAIVESALADRLTWVAYPKAGQLATDLNRDVVAALLIERGARPVRQIALDDVWSALRFRAN
jgi:hypothetical protein